MKLSKITNPYLIMAHVCRHFPFRLISDERYLRLFFRAHQGKKLDLNNPKTFNEKLQWLKIYDRNDIYTELSDKYKVREYVEKKIGKEYLVPLLGVWKSADDINYQTLPDKFVLKCNHDSGSVVVCHNKSELDIKRVNKKLNQSLKTQYFWKSREWNYKNIDRCIIAESYLSNDEEKELTDYKYFCFDGVPHFIQVDSGRFTNHVRNFYDMDWNFIDVQYGCKNDRNHLDEMPYQHKKMIELASILSQGFSHVRVDFYVSKGHIYFGELTFHHGGGVMRVSPYEYDIEWGNLLKLSLGKERDGLYER